MKQRSENHQISDVIRDFLIDRRARQLSRRTIENYGEKLQRFREFARDRRIRSFEEVTANDIRSFIVMLEEEGHNKGGVHSFWRPLKTIFLWFENEFEPDDWKNPIRKVVAPKANTDPIPGVPMSDVLRMIDTCDPRTFTGMRDIAIFRTLLDTGVRRSEFCNMRIMDINLDTGEIHVPVGKGDKARAVVVGPTARRDINRYLRKRQSKDPRDWLWVTKGNTQLQPMGLREIIRRRAKMANVACPSPHDFRRTFALECLRNGMDIIQLRRLMGHTSTKVLERYLALQTEDLLEAHEKCGPVDHYK